jgi:sarcosine oxidase
MSTMHADVIVVGLGVTGLSTAGVLARRGRSVVGIDRWGSGHPVTSSTGASRSIRVAYDDERYVRLAREAFVGWHRLEAEQGVSLLVESGQIDMGPDAKLEALAAAMRAGEVPFDELDANDARARFPELAMRPGERALFHAEGGTVLADAAMRALSAAARAAGAELSMLERCTGIEVDAGRARVTTGRRTLGADQVVIAAGPWSGELLSAAGIEIPLAPAVAQVTFLEAPQLVDARGSSTG